MVVKWHTMGECNISVWHFLWFWVSQDQWSPWCWIIKSVGGGRGSQRRKIIWLPPPSFAWKGGQFMFMWTLPPTWIRSLRPIPFFCPSNLPVVWWWTWAGCSVWFQYFLPPKYMWLATFGARERGKGGILWVFFHLILETTKGRRQG